MTHTVASLHTLMTRFNVTARKKFGQHFVVDSEIIRHMVTLSGVGRGDHVLEIGAGLGSLTLALAETGASVVAVEVDSKLADALRYVIAGITTAEGTPNIETVTSIVDTEDKDGAEVVDDVGTAAKADVQVVEGDARTLDYSDLLAASDHWHMVSNLPYNIATSLVIDLLSNVSVIKKMVVMLQRETAERLAAAPGSRARGIPSVLIECYGKAQVLSRVPPESFMPPPAVESAVLLIERYNTSGKNRNTTGEIRDITTHNRSSMIKVSQSDYELDTQQAKDEVADKVMSTGCWHLQLDDRTMQCLKRLLRSAFGQRRKMLRRSLAGLITSDDFEAAEVDPTARPELLTFQQWKNLATLKQH